MYIYIHTSLHIDILNVSRARTQSMIIHIVLLLSAQVWISLTIGTWPSPFWLLWGDSIWRDGPDVGDEGVGSARDRWLSFRDNALRRAQSRGPLFPLTAFMQHGVVWSKTAETISMWSKPKGPKATLQDFCNEVLSFFLAGTGLQELYIQMELMNDEKWKALAAASHLARQEIKLLPDARLIAFGHLYGAAALEMTEGRAIFWLRNPEGTTQEATFSISELLELPVAWQKSHWSMTPLQLEGCPAAPQTEKSEVSSSELVSILQPALAVQAWTVLRKDPLMHSQPEWPWGFSAFQKRCVWFVGIGIVSHIVWLHMPWRGQLNVSKCAGECVGDLNACCFDSGYPTLEQMKNTGEVCEWSYKLFHDSGSCSFWFWFETYISILFCQMLLIKLGSISVPCWFIMVHPLWRRPLFYDPGAIR